MNQKSQIQLDFDSEDTEGSDISFESSFDEQLEQEFEQTLQQKGIVQFKDQMERMMQLNQEIGTIKLEKANFEDEEELKKLFPPRQQENLISRKSISNIQIMSPRQKSQSENKNNSQWYQVSKNILNSSKKVASQPTLEEFQQRLNLFRINNTKSDIVDLIIEEQDKLLKDIQQQEKKNKAIENAVHESIEAKVRKETGDVGYVSFRKKIQFQFRIRKAEELAQEKVLKQKEKKETDMHRSLQIFDQLFLNRNYDEEGEVKSLAAEELYKKVKKCQDDIDVKNTIIQFIIQHRKKQIDEYKNKPTILKPTKFISEDSREFSLLQPNMQFRQQMMQQQLNKEVLDKRDDLEGENIYLLTKINQILEGNLMKLWKHKLGSKM
ncbi:unnamed protein product [Paramecium primaurelia]|uniref:Uncharacterized protein n=2 Tax=Paramecium TaxID=5884 RepID=A0A8S1THH9_9CILI|nr:unnamed protein product [Paramecium primaurelia]CAD8151237.1 unnamed protein product [Paramecium pentaurelia]